MEVCVDIVESAVNASDGGASRLELCSALSEGGLTPTIGLLTVVKKLVNIPVFVMLRPRRGIDFVYSANELDAILYDSKQLKEAGADGFVFGALTASSDIDIHACKSIVESSSPLPVTFHRAFDLTRDPYDALETIISLGFSRILTSGQAYSAEEGCSVIRNLISKAKNRISIMPGGGITTVNLKNIIMSTGASEFHASARVKKEICSASNICSVGSGDESSLLITSSDIVREMVSIYSNVKQWS